MFVSIRYWLEKKAYKRVRLEQHFSSNTLGFSISIKKVENFRPKNKLLAKYSFKKLFSLVKVETLLNYYGACYDVIFYN